MLRRRTHGDDGVVAVVTALLVAFVLLPVAGLGMSSYVRAGVGEEMQRAADSGALAAATSLLFVDLSGVRPGAASGLTFDPACRAAEASLGGRVPTRSRAPLSAAFTAPVGVGCSTSPAEDESYPQCVTGLVENAQRAVDELDRRLMQVSALVQAAGAGVTTVVSNPLTGATSTVTVTSGLSPEVTALVQDFVSERLTLAQRVFKLVPAAQFDGVSVDLTYQVDAPLDALFGPAARAPRKARGTARRLFKPLLPTGPGLTAALAGATTARHPRLATLLGTPPQGPALVSTTEQYAVALFQMYVSQIAPAAVVMAGEAVDAGAATTDQTFAQAARLLREHLSAAAPSVPASVLDLLTAAPPLASLNPLDMDCRVAATELFLALTRALEINDDPTGQDLTSCLVGEVLGVRATRTATVASCTGRLFRAQLRKDPR